MRLFVYGTLMDAEQVRSLLGRTLPMVEARAAGFRRVTLARLPYPFAIEDPQSCIEGVVLEEVSEEDLRLLDRYERTATGLFRRYQIVIQTEGKDSHAWIYVGGEALRRRMSREPV